MHIAEEEEELLNNTNNVSNIVLSVPASNAASVADAAQPQQKAAASPVDSIKEAMRRASDDVFSMHSKLPTQASFVLLSIKKRREILRVMEDYYIRQTSPASLNKTESSPQRASSSPTADTSSLMNCVSIGSHFEGEIRDLGLSIGAHKFLWRFSAASGRTVECNALSNEELFESFCGSLDDIPSCNMELHGVSVVYPKVLLPVSAIVLRSSVTLDLGAVRLPMDPTTTGLEVTFFAQLRQNFRKGGSPSTPSALANSQRGLLGPRPVQVVGYGHVLAIEDLLIFELQSNRVQFIVPVVVTEEILRETLPSEVADHSLELVGETHLVCLRSITSIFEDLQWHAVHVVFPKVRCVQNVQVWMVSRWNLI